MDKNESKARDNKRNGNGKIKQKVISKQTHEHHEIINLSRNTTVREKVTKK
jgi:hypothetical protein